MRAHLSILLVLAFSLTAAAGEPKPDEDKWAKVWADMTEEERSGQDQVLKVIDRRTLAQEHYAVGKRLHEDRLYEKAQQELALAVRYDPGHREAKELLTIVESTLAGRRARIHAAVQYLERREQIKRQEQLMKLENHLDRAKVLYARATEGRALPKDGEALATQVKQLEEADRNLVRAREIAKWMPAYVPVKDYETAIDALIDRVFKEHKAREEALKELGELAALDEAEQQKSREQEFRRRQVRMLMDKAEMLFARQDYDEAGRLAKRVQDIDPTNIDAIEMQTTCRIRAIDKRAVKTRDLKGEAIKDWVELSRRAMVPHSKLMVYPDNWDEISQRESIGGKRLQEADWKRDIRAALEQEVNLEFVDQPLEECIKYLEGLTEASIITDPQAFTAGGADPNTAITLRLNKTKLGLALRWILRMANLDYSLHKGAIFISTPDRLQGELKQRIYDVRDMTGIIPHFPGPELGLTTGTGGGATFTMPPDISITPPGSLPDMIQKVISPGSWGVKLGGAETSIEEKNGQLIVFHRPEVHAQISQLLDDFRKSQTLQVHVEARYVDVTQGFLEEIGLDWGGNPNATWSTIEGGFDPAHPSASATAGGSALARPGLSDRTHTISGDPQGYDLTAESYGLTRGSASNLGRNYTGVGEGLTSMWAYLGNFHAQALLKAVAKEEKSSVLFAPRLTMFNNQRAHILVGTQTSYISGWSSSGTTFTPDVATAILDGVSLDVRPIVSHDRRYITLELRPTLVRPAGISSFNANQATGTDSDDDGDGLDNTDPAETTPLGPFGGDIDGDTVVNQSDPDVDGDGLLNGSTGGTSLNFSLPELEIRTIRTVVTVPDGGTVLLSGLMQERQTEERNGIPFLMNIPVLGRAFSTDFKDIERRNLLILVSARLILFSEEEQKL